MIATYREEKVQRRPAGLSAVHRSVLRDVEAFLREAAQGDDNDLEVQRVLDRGVKTLELKLRPRR